MPKREWSLFGGKADKKGYVIGARTVRLGLENAMDYAQLNALCSNNDDGSTDQQSRTQQSNPTLRKNLDALARFNPLAARAIEQAQATPDARFVETDEGILSVELGGIAMASKRKPMREARRLAEQVDPVEVACCAVLGFGMGYHCGALLERLGSCGILICFEPDVGLLRSVLERVDYVKLFETNHFFLITAADDPATLTQIFGGIEAVVGLGVEIVTHPPSTGRLGEDAARFSKVFGDVLKATRTHVITTLANSRISFRNALMNLDHYASSAGIEPLKDSCQGKPAVVVSAGPSLERNVDLLADPEIRKSVVVIAVQTVLKGLLAKGIKPDFVAALDYHEISKRFYEGLNAQDVAGIRLIVEAKANPAILDAFPGEVLCVSDALLDDLLGEELCEDLGELAMGGTVAHLCYYFARHLGCDPVIFIGQDLGFTDGQYYSGGAAIHQVWAGELNAHNTLEMMEWERIVRMKGLLRKKTDIHGRAIYLDEQMATYLAQFESAFQQDTSKGLRIIDATEGGVRKAHTSTMTLRDAIDSVGCDQMIEIPSTNNLRREGSARQQRVVARLDSIIRDSERIAYFCEQALGLLHSMIKAQKNIPKVNRLIEEVQGIRDRLVNFETAYRLTEAVNQVGVLNRMKRDRVISMKPDTTEMDVLRMQIERDIVNVEWTRDAAKAVAKQLIAGREAFVGKRAKKTNDLDEESQSALDQDTQGSAQDKLHSRAKVHALVIADPQFGGLGNERSLGTQIVDGLNALQITLLRLSQADGLDGITILTPEPDVIKGLIGSIPMQFKIEIEGVDPRRFRARASRVGSARVQSGECWRGSIGMLGVYDEQVDLGLVSSVMHTREIDACAIVGGDWAMIDPELVSQTVQRYQCQEAQKRIAFSQAAPGLGTMVVDRVTIDALAASLAKDGNHFATLGTLVEYVPITPQFDPIAKGMCVEVDPVLRDVGVRMIADSRARIEAMRLAYQSLGVHGSVLEAKAIAYVGAFVDANRRTSRVCPRTIVLETCTGRLASGDWGLWKRNSIEPIERAVLTLGQAHKVFADACELRDDVAVVFDGVGDPLMHPDAIAFAQLAKEDGVCSVELRTDLLREGVDARELLESGIDILSVDVLAEHRATYQALTGLDRFDELYARLQTIFDEMHRVRGAGGMNQPWFVPRMMRCDAVYGEIEQFYDKWIMLCGSAVIDPLPEQVIDQRIRRLPIPSDRQIQLDRSTMYIRCDGAVVDRTGHPIRQINAFDEGIEQAYQKMLSAMRSAGDVTKVEPKLIGSVCTNESAA